MTALPPAPRSAGHPSPTGVRAGLPGHMAWSREFKAAAFGDWLRLVASGSGSEDEAWQLVALSVARALRLVKWAAGADEALAALSRHYGVDAFSDAAPLSPSDGSPR